MDVVTDHGMLNKDGKSKCLQPGTCPTEFFLGIVSLKSSMNLSQPRNVYN